MYIYTSRRPWAPTSSSSRRPTSWGSRTKLSPRNQRPYDINSFQLSLGVGLGLCSWFIGCQLHFICFSIPCAEGGRSDLNLQRGSRRARPSPGLRRRTRASCTATRCASASRCAARRCASSPTAPRGRSCRCRWRSSSSARSWRRCGSDRPPREPTTRACRAPTWCRSTRSRTWPLLFNNNNSTNNNNYINNDNNDNNDMIT